MSCKECETVRILLKEHLSEVAVSKSDFALVSYRTRDAESLKSLSDCCRCVCRRLAAFLDRDSRTYSVCPACVLKADWLDPFYLVIYIKPGIFCNLFCFFDRSDAIAS